jgi:two-component system response regulator YesN
VFKKNTGINYLTYLTEVRMEKAKELLSQLDMNLSQIANAVGYTSTRYFSKTFENEVGMKPSEYRRVYLREQR